MIYIDIDCRKLPLINYILDEKIENLEMKGVLKYKGFSGYMKLKIRFALFLLIGRNKRLEVCTY